MVQKHKDLHFLLFVGLARTIYIYGVSTVFSGREITKYTVIYGVYIYGSGQPYLFNTVLQCPSLSIF